ncbi:adenine phosphoribosyltransferase [Pseudoalteromonas sp. G4]|uniref:adenine phosphoribosyltransferase n=1 Tax=Pseudoalteromonas sp. G4 TaxID=2992761 RepID=UPI00237D40F8|nr:adenine phosphoribosyltransferase [Pseudoalteromonas sp. G4]MDE3274200.1 adenine phosphoribosyltransferase [Pseudoalteromonas sp. G4]
MTLSVSDLELVKNSIATVPDYPKPGIMFRDITSLLAEPKAFQTVQKALVEKYKDNAFDVIIGTESRGFIFGAPLALELGIPFVPVRKPGKLPRETVSQSYQLEYGEDTLEIHKDAIKPGDKVLLVDDLLATGGTIEATVKLVEKLGGKASDAAFVISLPELGGEDRLAGLGLNILKLVEFEGE